MHACPYARKASQAGLRYRVGLRQPFFRLMFGILALFNSEVKSQKLHLQQLTSAHLSPRILEWNTNMLFAH